MTKAPSLPDVAVRDEAATATVPPDVAVNPLRTNSEPERRRIAGGRRRRSQLEVRSSNRCVGVAREHPALDAGRRGLLRRGGRDARGRQPEED